MTLGIIFVLQTHNSARGKSLTNLTENRVKNIAIKRCVQ